MLPVAKLLDPVSADSPTGPDLEQDQELSLAWSALVTEAKGKPEQQFGDKVIEAQPGNWKTVQSGCLDLLGKTKHLEPAVYLLAAAIEQDGMAGLRDGLALLHGLLTQFWTELHPKPDEDEPDDFYARQGILENITLGYKESTSDVLRIIERLRKVHLCASREVGRFCAQDILAARAGEGSANTELIAAAFQKTDPAMVAQTRIQLEESNKLLNELDTFLKEKLGEREAPNFDNLKSELRQLIAMVSDHSSPVPSTPSPSASNPPSPRSPAQENTPSSHPTTSGGFSPGTINSRAEVTMAMNAIITYYRTHEPSSPIPYLLERARRLIDRDFVDIIKNLRSDLERDFRSLLDVREGEEAPPPPVTSNPAPPAQNRAPESRPRDDWGSANF